MRGLAWRLIGVTLVSLVVAGGFMLSEAEKATWEPTATATATIFALAVIVGFLVRGVFLIGIIDTWLHELGHATMSGLLGGTPTAIRLHADQSGVTEHRGGPRTLGSILVAAAGPCASSATLIGVSGLVSGGYLRQLLVFSASIVAVVLVLTVRNFIGWAIGLAILAAAVLAVDVLDGKVQELPWNLSVAQALLAICAMSAGGALGYSVRNLGPNGNGCDESKIGEMAGIPETLVDLTLIAINAFVIFWVWQSFGVDWHTVIPGQGSARWPWQN